jgi:DNA primase
MVTDMDAKDEIKQRLSIEDVISEYVQLKRAGRNWKGLSPFSAEKTPSFVVSPDKQIWHDFSSGRGGDVFSFVMEVEGLDFKETLELLARRAGIDMEQYRQKGSSHGPNSKTKDRLYEVLEVATHFYQTQFSKNTVALGYALKKRGFSKVTALEWRLGYSPNNGTALCDFLVKKGFTAEEIKLAGLSSQNYRGLGDMFRGRLQIPLCDPSGRVIGFTARLLEDDPQAPKYINTPSTPLYDKSRHVFGMHLAKESIRKTKYVVLAEGNLDVITSHQAGVHQVVATAGTALTEPHLKALSRLTGDIRLCFDADKAGLAATERAIPIAAKVGVSLSIITIPSGKDPDELIRQDVTIWQDIITKPQYAVDWLIERYSSQLDLTGAQGKRELSDVVLRVVRQLPDSVEQDHYLGKLAELLSVNKQALTTKLAGVPDETAPVRRRQNQHKPQVVDKVAFDKQRTEENLLALVLMQPKLRTALYPITPEMLDNENTQKVFNFLQEQPDYDGTDKAAVQKFADYAKILSLVYETLYQDLDSLELTYEATRLQAKLIEQYVRIQKQVNSQALATAEGEAALNLLRKDKQLTELLRNNGRSPARGLKEE